MTLRELINKNKFILENNNIDYSLAKKLYISMHKINEKEFILKYDVEISEQEQEDYQNNIEKLLSNIPIQYIIGHTNFYGYDFMVNSNVLIPRFETEELVNNTIEYINKYFNSNITIADIGTGSGAIGITIKKELPSSNIFITDISKEALQVAKHNSQNLKANVNLLEGNMLEPLKNTKIDIIISNPPYIKKAEEVELIVKDNEPNIALYGGIDGLKYYIEILSNAKNYLNNRSLIALEISDSIKEDVEALANKYFPDAKIIIKKDLQQRYRMLFILNNLD